jgi:uncharacterized protein YndB with AHSA1/START domain
MLLWISLVAAALLVAPLAAASARPASFRLRREIVIAAPPHTIFALLEDFHRWRDWSPWEDLDPAMTRSFSGASSGKGAIYEWSGNRKVGQGRMQITRAAGPRSLEIDLQFIAPWKARNLTQFEVTPRVDGTRVEWTMSGASPFMFRLMGLVMDMDAMIGKDFDKGLARLKALAEG